MNRLKHSLERAAAEEKKLLSLYVPAGYPRLDATRDLVLQIAESGADFIELGLPFSDPIADGPTIQAASQQAIRNGITLDRLLEDTRLIRQNSDIPLLFMGYFNSVLQFGVDAFAESAAEAGIDGLIIPDLLPDESDYVARPLLSPAVGLNFLIAPNTDLGRVRMIDRKTAAFLYCVSVTGVTGERDVVPEGLKTTLTSVRSAVTHPLLVGFGISRPDNAKRIAEFSDGVIIGSALIRHIADNAGNTVDAVRDFVTGFRTALDEMR